VIPALDEAGTLLPSLRSLAPLRMRGVEVLVADGGSTDGTPDAAAALVDGVVHCRRGRAAQMNAGAAHSAGDVIWFLHADTRAPETADRLIATALSRGADWGWFDVRLSGRAAALRVVEALMNLRSRLSRVATGDQGIFVRRSVFRAVGGFPDVPLMEDVAISKRLRRRWASRTIPQPLVTSSRRWERAGIPRTVMLMWRLRLLYVLGEPPERLARIYATSPVRERR
jgi:rSAM/selenodomain-associated transferase 2